MSRGRVCTQPFTAVENTPHDGQAAANHMPPAPGVVDFNTRHRQPFQTEQPRNIRAGIPSNPRNMRNLKQARDLTSMIRLRRQQSSSPRPRAHYVNDAPGRCPVSYGEPVWERHRRWSTDGTYAAMFAAVKANACEEDRQPMGTISVDSTSIRAH